MRVVIAADEDAAVVFDVARLFEEKGHETVRIPRGVWGKVALVAAQQVASGAADQGVVLCYTGTGVAMTANKVPGVRAALCVDGPTAAGARRWNDANVLALSLRLLTPALAEEIVQSWLGAVYTGTEGESLALLAELERPPS